LTRARIRLTLALGGTILPVASFALSTQLYDESSHYLAGGVSSNFRLGARPVPLFFTHGSGSHLYTVDGTEYLDYALGMGPVILGHAPPCVIRRVGDSLAKGQLYAGQHEGEVQLARRVCSVVPCADRVRFGSSGTEVVQLALRAARAFTSRQKIIKFEGHYHGWLDNIFIGVHPASASDAPFLESGGQDPAACREVVVLPWNDIKAFEQTLHSLQSDVAAVIMEPILCNTGVIFPRPGYLEGVRALCTAAGVILIFDEIITGFRVGPAGAQGLYGVTPDLAVFAKAMGGGFPISCLAGREPLMQCIASGAVTHGGTYNSNVVSIVAALATLDELLANDAAAYGIIDRLGSRLMDGIRAAARDAKTDLRVQGLGAVFHTAFGGPEQISDARSHQSCDPDRLRQFVDRLLVHGIRITSRGTWFLSTAHTERDIDDTIAAVARALN
jgi:glutamate-1-semialdehyde 2,1-aminomutase